MATVALPTEHEKQIIFKSNFRHFGTWIPDSRPFQPIPGRKFQVESEFEVKNKQIQRPGAKNLKNDLQTCIC